MKSLDKYWKVLILTGVLFMLLAVGWEIYQISSGNRDKFDLVVDTMPRERLLTPQVNEHFKNDGL